MIDMKEILENKNDEFGNKIIEALMNIGYTLERKQNVFKKDIPDSRFYILFKPEWLTFGLCLKDKKYECEARKVLSCKIFDKYNLTPVKDGLQYDKLVFRNFYYPSAIASEREWVKKAVKAFKKLEECIQKCEMCGKFD